MIVILNFGSQFAHLIARRVRSLGVHSEIVSFDISAEELKAMHPSGIILSGGPSSVLDADSPLPHKEIFDLGIPLLGICYGHQAIAHLLGGKVQKGKRHEFGKETLALNRMLGVLAKLGRKETVWFSHGDTVTKLPPGFSTIASTAHCKNAAFLDAKRRVYAIQFHPEVTHTMHGTKILSNFVLSICKAKRNWESKTLSKSIVADIAKEVGKEHVLVALSGGVDSLVAATLVQRAIGKNMHGLFVDTGLLRKDEVAQVSGYLKKHGFKSLTVVNAQEMFLGRLAGVTDPEAKRKIIGHAFIEVFEREVEKLKNKYNITYLAQGTIYPDRIESAAPNKQASKIKTHHNLALPEKMKLKVLEPLKDLYKDEVREVGLALGLPRELVYRHPFPGPGLAIRIVGEVTPERVKILQEADAIYLETLKKEKEYDKIWQAFAALLPVKVVGVMGDARTYEYVLALRAVDSVDGMTADWHKMPHDLLQKISSNIIGSVRGVNRVLYDITQKPPATIEYE
jgi:GMP synthase (glutamine-hydrolysing)